MMNPPNGWNYRVVRSPEGIEPRLRVMRVHYDAMGSPEKIEPVVGVLSGDDQRDLRRTAQAIELATQRPALSVDDLALEMARRLHKKYAG